MAGTLGRGGSLDVQVPKYKPAPLPLLRLGFRREPRGLPPFHYIVTFFGLGGHKHHVIGLCGILNATSMVGNCCGTNSVPADAGRADAVRPRAERAKEENA